MEGFAWTGVYPNYAWTPDGRSIVIYSNGGFDRVDVASGEATRIPFTAQVEQIITHAVRFPQKLGADQVRIRQIAWPALSPDAPVYEPFLCPNSVASTRAPGSAAQFTAMKLPRRPLCA